MIVLESVMTMDTRAPVHLASSLPEAIEVVGPEWNRLAMLAGSPFLTHEWITSWWKALGDGQLVCALLPGADGLLRGGACCRLSPAGQLTSPTDPAYSYEWNVVAEDDA